MRWPYSGAGPFREAFRWSGGQMVGLGDLPGGVFSSGANAVSSDGQMVVGSSSSSQGSEAFRWTPQTGLQGLGDLPGGEYESAAHGVSSDGSVIVGSSQTDTTTDGEAFRWTTEAGLIGLGLLPGGSSFSGAMATSADGAIILGNSDSAQGTLAFLWTLERGLVPIGDFFAQSLSADGTRAVGSRGGGSTAVVWDEAHGVRVLRELLTEGLGLDLDGWVLTRARDISADGIVIVGTGTNPLGQSEAWLAVIPEPATLILLGFGIAVMVARRRSHAA